jgi:hypothetical protein
MKTSLILDVKFEGYLFHRFCEGLGIQLHDDVHVPCPQCSSSYIDILNQGFYHVSLWKQIVLDYRLVQAKDLDIEAFVIFP